MKVRIVGQDTLAAATREACSRFFEVGDEDAHVIWVCYDTPLSRESGPNTAWVMQQISDVVERLAYPVPILVSSQMPVGTIRELERQYPLHIFAYAPENIRVKTGLADFLTQARIVVGRRSYAYDHIWAELFAPFTSHVIYTTPETAEMVKHALNCYLGLCIAWMNEIAAVGEVLGIDQQALEHALLSERRVSADAPLHAGGPFGGGHLARDIWTLEQLGKRYDLQLPIIEAIAISNGGLR